MADKIYVADLGTIITLDCKEDISDGDVFTIEVKKPSGTEVTWTAALSGTDSVTYTTIAGDFDESGTYCLQAKVTKGVTLAHRGETVEKYVYAHFK